MATETLYSGPITNRDATPRVLNTDILDKGQLQESIGSVTIVTGKTVGSIYVLCSVPAAARVSQVLLTNPALSASTAFDVGVYRTTSDGAAVVSAALFGSAIACTSANANLDVTNESGTYTVDKQEMPLWQAAGLTTNPGGSLDICLTSTATNAAGGLIGAKVRFVL